MIGFSGVKARVLASAAVVLTAAFLTAPAWAADYTPGAIDKSLAGTTIDLLVPPWAAYSQKLLDDFTVRTGITVNVESVDFDSIHDKVVTAAASGQAVADVIELDWTWVSQFGSAGWLAPLDKLLTPQQLQDAVGANSFVFNGQQVGLPYSLDFRGSLINMTKFKKAGITAPPATWSELLDDAKKLKAAGVSEYPIALPLSITENTSTPWYMLVRAAGGEVLDDKGQPAFATNGLGVSSLQFIRDAYAAGVIDPGAIGLTQEQVDNEFLGGSAAVMLSAYPGAINFATPGTKGSNIVGDELAFIHVPGDKNNTGGTIALEEALAIPALSKNQQAAAMYLSWALDPNTQIAAYKDSGPLPTNQNALKTLSTDPDNKSMMESVLSFIPSIEPVIPGGPPTWYTKFSAEVAATIQAVALGQVTAEKAVEDLAAKTKQIAAQAN